MSITNAFARWTPIGGVGGFLVYSVVHGHWSTAIVIFLATVVAGVWAAYTESFSRTFRAGASELGNNHAQKLLGTITRVSNTLRYRFKKADLKFAQAQAEACRDYLVEGLGEARFRLVPELNEVYVPLTLGNGLSATPSCNPVEALEETQYIWDFLRQVETDTSLRRMAIVAPGGFGKTTLLRFMAYRYGLEREATCREKQVPPLVPILLYMRECRDTIAQATPPDLPTLIAEHALPKLPGKPLTLDVEWATALLQSRKALVMLDGFDEVAADDCEAVSHWIDAAVNRYGRTALFIFSSRPAGYARYIRFGRASWRPVGVKAFNEEQRNDFLQRWYVCQTEKSRPGRNIDNVKSLANRFSDDLIRQIDERKALARLANNPLLLVMIATYHRYNPSGRLPIGRRLLYQGFLNLLLEDRPASKGILLALDKEDGQLVLQNIALTMVQEDCIALSESEMVNRVQRTVETLLDGYTIDASQWLGQLEEVSELLVRRASAESYEFAHRSFQEYLAAAEVKRRRAPELLVSLESEWRDTAIMYATQTNPTELIDKLCGRADLASLDTAYDCYLAHKAERAEQAQVPSQTFERIKELRYHQLEKHLSERDWKRADEYTYRLMLQVLEKRYGDYFTKEELLNFPCEDLSRIDGLWVSHSNGELGFSVQKDIYVRCGGLLDGQYHRESYAEFFQTVRWCKDSEKRYDDVKKIVEDDMVRSYEDLTSEHPPTRGSFPDMNMCARNGGGWICFLSFRLNKCRSI